MGLPNSIQWTHLLWEYFTPQIRSGGPVYLAVDAALLRELAGMENELTPLEVADAFHETCNELLYLSSAKARIKDGIFTNLAGKHYSKVILLAVQQVLVVERMLNDQSSDVSENAYFPRYRECLGLDRYGLKSNPLVEGYFQRIWNQLELEFSKVPGFSESTVTFFSGTGPDLNRKLPFSQALLTNHDLSILKNQVPSLTKESDASVILHSLYRVRNQLGRRASRLISATDLNLRNRICKQVQAFLAYETSFSTTKSRASSGRTSPLRIYAHLDREEIYDVVFKLTLRRQDEQLQLSDHIAEINRKLKLDSFLPMVAREDGYAELSNSEVVVPGEALLLLLRKEDSELIRQKLVSVFGQRDANSFVSVECNTPGFSLFLCEFLPNSGIDILLRHFQPQNIASRISLKGGLVADERSRIYVIGYPPHEICFDGTELSRSEMMFVGGKRQSVGEFLDTLRNEHQFKSYQIEYKGVEIDFALAFESTENQSGDYGYPLNNERLLPIALPIEESQSALKGFVNFEEHAPTEVLSTEELKHALVYPILRSDSKFILIRKESALELQMLIEDVDLPIFISNKIGDLLSKNLVPISPFVQKLNRLGLGRRNGD